MRWDGEYYMNAAAPRASSVARLDRRLRTAPRTLGRYWYHPGIVGSGIEPLSVVGKAPIKRFSDVLGSAILLLLLAPFLLAVGCIVRLDSPGPAIFWQARRGLRGKPFLIAKFRTMRNEADTSG